NTKIYFERSMMASGGWRGTGACVPTPGRCHRSHVPVRYSRAGARMVGKPISRVATGGSAYIAPAYTAGVQPLVLTVERTVYGCRRTTGATGAAQATLCRAAGHGAGDAQSPGDPERWHKLQGGNR